MSTFSQFSLSENLVQSLNKAGIETPTPIQVEAIPPALEGEDLIGIAQTGTGKTLAFAIPIAERLEDNQRALVLAPTRELAQQIEESFRLLKLKSVLIVGGAPMHIQIKGLKSNPDVIIATPGRLIDHMNQGTVRLNTVSIIVLDEADRMLDMGFAPAIKRILGSIPESRQTLLFSATMPGKIEALAREFMNGPILIEIESAGLAPDLVEQELQFHNQPEKPGALFDILKENEGSVLVFARTRHGARKLTQSLRNGGHSAAEIHSDRTLGQRREALRGFKTGDYRVLVATDIAARGIDVKEISLVVNYDLPDNPEDYLHRIGRTGRAGAKGRAITIATPDQSRDIKIIENLMKSEIEVSPLSTASPRASRPSGGGMGGNKRNTRSFRSGSVSFSSRSSGRR